MNDKHPVLDKWLNNKNKVVSTDKEIVENNSSDKKDNTKQGTAWGRKKGQSWEDKMIELTNQSLKRSKK